MKTRVCVCVYGNNTSARHILLTPDLFPSFKCWAPNTEATCGCQK